ncbi:MAG TPA: DNA polymerase III, subunit gamma and tau, partial [Cryomorphaceae bacterium]|nr:DNA polymerase III, subunit gamma and tau [Cryomorphaceae bacterium]
TCARILARRINEVHTGPDQDYSLNIFELDAASNNSVDDIRQLIDQVRFAPQVGRFKVYIIDEVHMLSQAAFNAFLKTLEEPPAHTIFILATTEKHKVLPTILSRCQIFDFKRIGLQDIANHLAFVAGKEGIAVEEEALHAIAEKADGALRDSLSIFDRVAAFARGGTLTYALVRENLQMLDRTVYFSTVSHLLTGDTTALLLQVDHILEQGFDLHRYVGGLASHVRDVLLAKHEATVALMDVPDSVKEQYRQQAQQASPAFLANALKALSQCDLSYRSSSNPRLLVEIALLELAGMGQGSDEKKKTEPQRVEVQTERTKQNEAPQAPVVPPVVAEPTSTRPPGDESTPEPVAIQPVAEAESHTDSATEAPPAPTAEALLTAESIAALQIAPITEATPSTSEVHQTEEQPNRKRRSTFSLKANISGTAIAVDETAPTATMEPEVKRLSSFSQNALETAWMDAVKSMEDRPVIHSVISKATPVLEDEFRIRISVENKVQADYLEGVRDELVGSLRALLENDAIRWAVHVEEGPSNARIVYTPEERFQFLLDKNPHLAEFRKEFKLELE